MTTKNWLLTKTNSTTILCRFYLTFLLLALTSHTVEPLGTQTRPDTVPRVQPTSGIKPLEDNDSVNSNTSVSR